MCPPRVREGGGRSLWQPLRQLVWDRFTHRQPLSVLLVAALLAVCTAFYFFPLLSACALCVLGCRLCQSSGRRLLVLAGWRPQLGFVQDPSKRPNPPRRQRGAASFKWSPADLLVLMGSYLGKQDAPARAQGRGAREIKDRLTRPNPDVATPARRLSFRETPMASSRAYMGPRRRFPVNQTQLSMAGSFSSLSLNGCQTVLSPRNLVRSPVIVRLPSPDRNIENASVHNMPYGSGLPAQFAPDPCAKDTMLTAIKESRKRQCKTECPVPGDPDNKRRRRGSEQIGAHFEPLVPNGLASSFVSKEILFDSNKDYMNRRYPIHQPQYSKAGSLPVVFLDGYQKKPVLSPKSVFRPGTVRIPPPDRNHASSVIASLPYGSTPAPDPCAKETVLNALKECRKRQNKDEEYVGDGDLDNKRKRHGSGCDQTSDKLIANGPTSFVSKADSMKRGQNLQTPEENFSKRSRTSSSSSLSSGTVNGIQMSARNAIASSYSSSKELLKKRKLTLLNKSQASNSSRCETPEWPIKKKGRQELNGKSPITPLKSDSGLQSPSQYSPVSKGSPLSLSPNGSAVIGRRRKVLLTCPERDEPYQLPPAPIVGYEITTEDYDAEKKAALQRLNRALEDVVPITTTPPNMNPLTLPTSTKSLIEPQTSTPCNDALLKSLAKMKEQENSPGTVATLVQSPAATIPNGTFSFTAISSSSGTQASVSNTTSNLAAPIITSSCATVSSQALGSTQLKSQSPKNGLLLQMLSKPQENTQSAFKPIFGVNTPANSSSTQSAADPAVAVSTVASTTFKPVFGDNLKQTAPSSETTFKPIFGDGSTQLSTSTPFSFPTAPQTSSSNSLIPASDGSKNGAQHTSVIHVPANSTTCSSTVPAFQFGVASQTQPTSSTTSVLGNSTAQTSQSKQALSFGQTLNAQASGFGSAQTASAAQSKQSSAFGSTSSAFSAPFGSSSSQSFPGNSGTSAFPSSTGSEGQATKPASALPNFGTLAPTPFGASPQTVFGSNTQSAFGASVQPALGTTNTTINFGNSTPAATKPTTFGSATTQVSSSTANTNIFGASATPFSFNAESNTGLPFNSNSQSASTTGSTAFNFGVAQPAAPSVPFGIATATPNNIGTQAQNSTFAFGTSGATESKLPFGTSTPAFSHSAPATGLTFQSSTSGFANAGPSFGPSTPSFSIGSGSKQSGARQRLMARRQHTRKK